MLTILFIAFMFLILPTDIFLLTVFALLCFIVRVTM